MGIPYHIRIRGFVSPDVTDWFYGMQLVSDQTRAETVLDAKLADQAALLGILFTLHNMNLEIISVQSRAEDAHNAE